MNSPVIAGTKPRLVKFEKQGDTILWCACGRSARQPYCDGSHKGTGLTPVRVAAKSDNEEALLCLCKRTKSPPYCDGSHNSLGAGYGADDASGSIDWVNAELAPRSHGAFGYARLDGACFVLTPQDRLSALAGGWRIASTIAPSDGADRLSQWLLAPAGDKTDPLKFGRSEIVLFVSNGDVEIDISGKRIAAPKFSAVAIRPGESFAVCAGGAGASIVATVCPPVGPELSSAGEPFDERYSRRTGETDPSAREEMGDRFFQVLTAAERGSHKVTQFIGMIPKSRAAAHRHLYEETLYVISGEGFMWTETRRAAVKPGDIVYLPRKQLHSLECVSPGGMLLAGSFFPAGSPAINY